MEEGHTLFDYRPGKNDHFFGYGNSKYIYNGYYVHDKIRFTVKILAYSPPLSTATRKQPDHKIPYNPKK